MASMSAERHHRSASVRLLALALVLVGGTTSLAVAKTRLAEFAGEWHGTGTDRSSPLETAQSTDCRMKIQADERDLVSDTRCSGQQGLAKSLHLAVVVDGGQVSGKAKQKTVREPGRGPDVLDGLVSGTRSDEEADLVVRFPGLTPNASIVLTRSDPSTFNMHISSLGLTLTDVTFHRVGAR